MAKCTPRACKSEDLYCPFVAPPYLRTLLGSSLLTLLSVVTVAFGQNPTNEPVPPQAPADAPTSGVLSPEEQAVRVGLDSAAQYLADKKPERALEALQPVEAAEADNPWLGFYKGLARSQQGRWYEAMEAFDRAEDLLASYGQPDATLHQSIVAARREARRQVFGVSYSAGVAYDSNVTFLGSGGSGGTGLISGQGNGKFTSRLQIAGLAFADEDESVMVGARVANTWNFSIEQFNYQDYGGTVRYTRKLEEAWQASLQYDYDITYLGNQPFLSAHVVTPKLTYLWDDHPATIRPDRTGLYYRVESRDFLFATDPLQDRDGFTNAVGVEQTVLYRPLTEVDWTWTLRGGYDFGYDATEGDEFDQLLHTYYLGFDVPFTNPWLPDRDAVFRFNANWQQADYRNESLFDEDDDRRSDLITTLEAVITQQLIEDPDLGDLFLHSVVSWTDAESNVTTRDGSAPFTYEKWVVGIQFEWNW